MNPQFIIDGLVAGSMIGLGAIGVTLTYSILRFANFAHGEFISWGAYLALTVAGALGALAGSLLEPIGPFSFGWALPIGTVAALGVDRRAGARRRPAAVRAAAGPTAAA